MSKIVLTNGVDEISVRVCHWWPGREWDKVCPIPSFVVKKAEAQGSKYLTYAQAVVRPTDDLDTYTLHGSALCCSRDFPSRAMGREIAPGRLAKEARTVFGFELVTK